MTGPLYWTEEAPNVEERKGVFYLTVKNGSSVFNFVMPAHLMEVLGVRATKEVKTFHNREDQVIRLVPGDQPRRRAPQS